MFASIGARCGDECGAEEVLLQSRFCRGRMFMVFCRLVKAKSVSDEVGCKPLRQDTGEPWHGMAWRPVGCGDGDLGTKIGIAGVRIYTTSCDCKSSGQRWSWTTAKEQRWKRPTSTMPYHHKHVKHIWDAVGFTLVTRHPTRVHAKRVPMVRVMP